MRTKYNAGQSPQLISSLHFIALQSGFHRAKERELLEIIRLMCQWKQPNQTFQLSEWIAGLNFPGGWFCIHLISQAIPEWRIHSRV